MSETRERPAWVRRFMVPEVRFPAWSPGVPDRLVVVSGESGSLQAWAWDIGTGKRRRLSDEPVGADAAFPTPDGNGVVWFRDTSGEESGRWVVVPWEGSHEAQRLVEGVPDAWSTGISFAAGVLAVATCEASGSYGIWVSHDGRPARALWRTNEPAGIGREWEQTGRGLSADGSLLCIWHCERGDIHTHGLRVLTSATGEVLGEVFDPGRNLQLACWSPVPGDQRVALAHEREGIQRPALWDLRTGERIDLPVDLPGEVDVLDWWPDGSALLLKERHRGRDTLHCLELSSGTRTLVVDPHGSVSGSAVRPDGSVWMRVESGARLPRILDQGGLVLIDVPGPADMPDNRPYSPFSFENPAGQRVDGFVATPGGEGPFPTVMSVHGGPEWEDADAFDARVQAFTDHGCAVGMVNYRGSTGQGADWREALRGDIGFPETEDVVVGLDALVDAGIADPERAFIEGASWGGYITLLAIGLHPERWRGAVASVPVGDLVACHEDCSPAQQAYDVAIMGGDPTDLPELYAERSPITYVGSVRCPVLVFAGEHDSACPIRQVRNYVRALEAHGGRVTLRTRSFGHHANTAGERIEEMRLALEFLQAQMGAG